MWPFGASEVPVPVVNPSSQATVGDWLVALLPKLFEGAMMAVFRIFLAHVVLGTIALVDKFLLRRRSGTMLRNLALFLLQFTISFSEDTIYFMLGMSAVSVGTMPVALAWRHMKSFPDQWVNAWFFSVNDLLFSVKWLQGLQVSLSFVLFGLWSKHVAFPYENTVQVYYDYVTYAFSLDANHPPPPPPRIPVAIGRLVGAHQVVRVPGNNGNNNNPRARRAAAQ